VRALYVQPLSKGFDNHKGIVWPFEIGGVTRLIRSGIKKKTGGPASFFYNFNDTISREELKTFYSGLRITNKSELTAFFSPRHANLKISHCILFFHNPTIQEDDLLRLAKSQKKTYREWLNPAR
jgi:hypothetical protein